MAVAVLHQIRLNRIVPRRESLTRIEPGAILKHPYESFLRRISGVLLVLQGADEVVEQFSGMALHEVVQRCVMAGGEADHVRPVAFVMLCVVVAHELIFTEQLSLPPSSSPFHYFSVSAMPHLGQLPGVLCVTSGCMAQVYCMALVLAAGLSAEQHADLQPLAARAIPTSATANKVAVIHLVIFILFL